MKSYSITCVKKMDEKRILAKELADNMRKVDKKEIEGMGFSTLRGAEVSIYDTSPVYVARANNGKLIACWGLQILIGKHKNTYLIWALGTDEIAHYKKAFIKESTALLNRWVELYGELVNTVACFNKESIKWLKWLGAEFSEPYKIGNTDYMDFRLSRKKG